MKLWLTYAEAAFNFGRSKRTLRLWVQESRDPHVNPMLRIRTTRDDQGRFVMSREDLDRVRAFKDAYRDTPTFGRR